MCQKSQKGETNTLGYELYRVVGEANGQALPLAFAFTALMDQLQKVQRSGCFKPYWATRQLCTWHGIKYLEERLAENNLPAKYDPRNAHKIFKCIDPIWAPGVTEGRLEEGVHEDDAVTKEPDSTLDGSNSPAAAKVLGQAEPATCTRKSAGLTRTRAQPYVGRKLQLFCLPVTEAVFGQGTTRRTTPGFHEQYSMDPCQTTPIGAGPSATYTSSSPHHGDRYHQDRSQMAQPLNRVNPGGSDATEVTGSADSLVGSPR
ncbi:hypothetical protein DFH06DRAFT_1130404 [Mycena polygramma]|nr:hypothetical protein DFH06DRAFT_1130404 [Mycena polygramma]